MAIKVFAVNDTEWWAAESADEAANAACSSWGSSRDEAIAYGLIEDPVEELGDEAMATLQVNDDSALPEGQIVKRSFREELDRLIATGATFPCMFASTEY